MKLPAKTQIAVMSPAATLSSPYWAWKKTPRKLARPTKPPNVML